MSFADSLNKRKMAQVATLSMPEVAVANEPAVMTLSAEESLIPAYNPSNEIMTVEENWKKPSNSHLYDYYDGEYADDKISEVDENKNIALADGQINLTQEKNSQYIPFQMNRKYDGFDLSETEISFYWVNRLGAGSTALPVDVYYNEETDKIKFAWLVDDDVTMLAGDIEFEIHADGTNSKGYRYVWKTKSNKLNVIQALEIQSFIEPDDTWQESFIEKVSAQANKAEQANTEAQKALEQIKDIVTNLENGITEEVQNIVDNNYYTKLQTEAYVQEEIAKIDISDRLGDTGIDDDGNVITVVDFVNRKINDIDGQFADYALKEDLPKNISELTNDAGYLTEHQSLEAYALKTELPSIEGLASEQYVKDSINEIPKPNLDPYALKEELPKNLSELTNDSGFVTGTFVQEEIAKVDISDELGNLVDSDGNKLTVEDFVKQEVKAIDVSDQLENYAKSEDVYKKEETYTKTEVDTAVKNVKVDLTGYAKETFVQEQISPINASIATINATLDSIDKSPNAQYVTTYNQPYTVDGVQYTGENTLVVYEIYHKDTEQETRTVVSSHVITGGSGGASSSNVITIERITPSPMVVTQDDKVIIEYNFTGTDSAGDDIGQCKATWKIGNRVVKTENVYTGKNFVNLTEYIGVGSDQKITLTISDDIGTIQPKTWYVSVVDVKLESPFDDTRTYEAGSTATFTYTPKGAVDKTVHFLMDGEEIDTKESLKASAGLSDSYVISAQDHGSHLFEVYMTASINNNDIESNHIVKDIIWYDENSTVPVIGCVQQKFTAKQYETTNIVYTVFDPTTETPTVEISVDGVVVSTPTLTANTDTYLYKTDVIGEHIITIACGETVKTLVATIEDLGIEVSPTTVGLEFDFNPVGYSNNDVNRIWSDSNTGVTMSVSDNFDWVNGGYQIDDAGDQYFCVKAGTTATINYNLFADDAKENGKEFKVIFKTTNVKKRATSFISCMDYGIGLDMKVESANIYSSNGNLYSPYCEDDVIEFEFNINKNTEIPMVGTYEDGVGNRPMIYTSDSSFWQTNPTPIVIGSDNCDVWIYRMKAYSTSLSDRDILNNFIADARSAEEMVNRYKRNQIYKEGVLDPEYLAEVCPDLRIILIDAPWFTNDKDNKIDDTNITMIYKNGDPVLDNWTCTGARHRGRMTCPLYMETYIYEAQKKTGMLKCKSEWKAKLKNLVTCNA